MTSSISAVLCTAAVAAITVTAPSSATHPGPWVIDEVRDAGHFVAATYAEIGQGICDEIYQVPAICYCVAGGRGVHHDSGGQSTGLDVPALLGNQALIVWISTGEIAHRAGLPNVDGVGIEVRAC